jgi:hypothetical protein
MADKIFSFSATETGYNHIKAEPSKVCEDASGFYDDDQLHICVVADGHGSDNYPRTDRGSQFAVDVAIEQIKAFVGKIYNPNSENPEISEKESNELIDKLLHTKINETHLLQYLSRNILMKWREFVEKDVEENPFQESEMANVSEKYKKRYMPEDISERRAEKAYGCTLIAYVVAEKFSFGMQIGDGKCVVIDQNGSISEPIPWDENCQMNVTTSICDSDASDEFRFFVTEEKPSAVFCGSDGIDDSYAKVEEMYALYRSILKIFVEHGVEVGKSEIKEYLPVLTKRGSGDDVSIALIMDIQRVTELTPVFTVQTELFNLENQLKEKQHTAAVNEEKEKALTSKMSAMMRPGIRTPLDHQIYNQINELRVTMTQMDEEILTLQRKIDNLKLRMPNVVAQCEPGMAEVNTASDSDVVVNAEEDIAVREAIAVEYVEIAARVEDIEEASIVNDEAVAVDGKSVVSEQSATAEETETHESGEMTASESQKIVISEKTVTIAEQMAKVSQMAEQPAVNEEAEVDTKASAKETPEE